MKSDHKKHQIDGNDVGNDCVKKYKYIPQTT